ncbi:hypothetical protein ACLOJK_041946, partial [Asimina triloba]
FLFLLLRLKRGKAIERGKGGKMSDEEHHFEVVGLLPSKLVPFRKERLYCDQEAGPARISCLLPITVMCPIVKRTDYQLIDITEDSFTKDDPRLPTDESLLSHIKDGFGEGKDLVVTVMSAMGEEQICALKDIGPKERTQLHCLSGLTFKTNFIAAVTIVRFLILK